MSVVYIIMRNDYLMVEKAFESFEDAASACYERTGFVPLAENCLYQSAPMDFVKIYQLEIMESKSSEDIVVCDEVKDGMYNDEKTKHTENILHVYGINIRDSSLQFRPFHEVIHDLGVKLKEMRASMDEKEFERQKTYILSVICGERYRNEFM